MTAPGGTDCSDPVLDARVEVQLGTLHLDVELHVAANELVVLVGPNGAGKSSLLRAIAGLTPIDAGTIRLEGTVLDDPSAGIFVPPEKRPVALMFQDGLLFRHLDALDNVAFGPRKADAQGRRQRARARAARPARPRSGSAREAARALGRSGAARRTGRALAVEPRACSSTSRSPRSTRKPAWRCGARCATSSRPSPACASS